MEQTTETPARRTMRQWFQGRLATDLLQAGQMAEKTELLLRGARKMQDGTLGQSTGEPQGMEDMNIRVGDETHHHYPAPPVEAVAPSPPPVEPVKPTTPKPSFPSSDLLGKAVLAAALMGTGGAIGVGALGLMGAFDKPDPPVATAPSDKDTITQIGIR